MERQYIEKWFSNEGNRNDVRKRVIACFMNEDPSTGAGADSSKYTYYVETLADGNRVYLTRPAFLNKGFDFVIRVENADYGHKGPYKNAPSHKDISIDLEEKKKENPEMYKKFYDLLKKVFECHDVTVAEYSTIHFECGLTPEHILKVIKWLFIEQDIAYWSYSGRNMTWGLVPSRI